MTALTLRQARDAYLAENGFSTDAYTDRWVKVEYGPVTFWLPSTKTRRAAIRFHDLHHALTGYKATPVGEAEIGAWEIATGIGRFWAGWVLNLFAVGFGMVLAPRRTFRAFVRGRHTRTNFYVGEYDPGVLDKGFEQVKTDIGLPDEVPKATGKDLLAFVGWSLVGLMQYVLAGAVVLVPIALLVWWLVL